MPDTALRFLETTKKRYGASSAFYIDFIQAYLMTRDFRAAEEMIETAVERNFMPQLSAFFLARFYFAGGKKNQLKSILEKQNATYEKYLNLWTNHLNSA